ncbi:hypothetical protein Taro_014277, partial [Colocasia esculenta]|nr:hypothetical protein [Colocasia esculenta]
RAKKATSRSSKAGLQFPVGRIARLLKAGKYAERIGAGAPVYLAAVLEYLSTEVLELAGNAARDNKKTRSWRASAHPARREERRGAIPAARCRHHRQRRRHAQHPQPPSPPRRRVPVPSPPPTKTEPRPSSLIILPSIVSPTRPSIIPHTGESMMPLRHPPNPSLILVCPLPLSLLLLRRQTLSHPLGDPPRSPPTLSLPSPRRALPPPLRAPLLPCSPASHLPPRRQQSRWSPALHEKREASADVGKVLGQCFVVGVPGSFHERLFQSRSIHFFHSSSSLIRILNAFSKVPPKHNACLLIEKVWTNLHLPRLGHGTLERPGLVPLVRRWVPCRDTHPLEEQLASIQDAIDIYPQLDASGVTTIPR